MEPIVIFAMNQKGEGVLRHLLERYGKSILRFVVVPRPHECSAGDRFLEIQELCRSHGVSCYIRDAHPPVEGTAFAIGWRWMIVDAPQLIITHDSLLPKYRGFAPLVTSLINGERTVGVTAFLANGRYDEGPILGQKSIAIDYPLKIQEAIQLVIPLYAGLVTAVIEHMLSGQELVGLPQDDRGATYSLWLEQDDYRIDWAQDAETLKRFIDAVGSPYEGASTRADGEHFRVLDAQALPDVTIERRHPGKILFLEEGIPTVVCGKGLLKITNLRESGSAHSALPWKKFRTRFH